ncbi:MAG: hypothetical protein JWP85_2104 [Rhodoglobus sp.]|nr:hypothetical protein [Rhodoglobus sp.]
MTKHVTAEDLERTRQVLAELAQRQEELGAQLDDTGLVAFVDRADWLLAHRTPDERLAAERRWERLCRRYGIPYAERPRRALAVRFTSLSVPKVHHGPLAITEDRALAIALGAKPQEHPERRTA